MKQFLISCYHEVYCQGMDRVHGTFLVQAITFHAACEVLKAELDNAHQFDNRTYPQAGIPIDD